MPKPALLCASILFFACNAEPASMPPAHMPDGTGGAESAGATGGTTGTGGSGPASDAGSPPDTSPAVDTKPADQCGPLRCLTAISLENASFKDKDSNRGVIAKACYTDGRFVENIKQHCAFSETCVKQGDNEPTCVSCGAKGLRYVKETYGTKVTRDCEGCGCNFAFSCRGAGQGGPAGGASINIHSIGNANFFVMADGKIAPSNDVDQKVQMRAVNKLEIIPGGAIDIEFVIDNVHVDGFGRREAVHAEARLVGNCSP